MNWLLDSSGVLLVLSGLVALVYELYALKTNAAPTITDIVRTWEGAAIQHKWLVSGVGLAALLGIAGLLVHFLGGF